MHRFGVSLAALAALTLAGCAGQPDRDASASTAAIPPSATGAAAATTPPGDGTLVTGVVVDADASARTLTVRPDSGGRTDTYFVPPGTAVEFEGGVRGDSLADIRAGHEVELRFDELEGRRTIRTLAGRRGAGSEAMAAGRVDGAGSGRATDDAAARAAGATGASGSAASASATAASTSGTGGSGTAISGSAMSGSGSAMSGSGTAMSGSGTTMSDGGTTRVAAADAGERDAATEERPARLPATATSLSTWAALGGAGALLLAFGLRRARVRARR